MKADHTGQCNQRTKLMRAMCSVQEKGITQELIQRCHKNYNVTTCISQGKQIEKQFSTCTFKH